MQMTLLGNVPDSGRAIVQFSFYIIHSFERETRFELATYSLEGYRSTSWATPAFFTLTGGEWRIRTSEGVHQQIYSLIHLATLETPQIKLKNRAFALLLSLELQNYKIFVLCQQDG